jgi:formylglycine-generating enzyme required for sulfatase activity/tRNA A-37 threonylcarbamoyl transferase component Bud32
VLTECPTREALVAFHRGTLAPGEVTLVATHVERCDRCEAELARLDDAPGSLVAGLRGPLPAGPTLPGYELLAPLGRGGMGVVYRARQVSLNREVAVKQLRVAAGRGRAEAETLARLRHPNIVQIHEVVEHAGGLYLVLELVEGGSLDAKLGGNPQPPRAAAELVEAVARAVHFAHDHGIVHRDLKPANVLMAGPVPKVADFGIAKQMAGDSGETRDGDVIGSPSYMAPEQAGGRVGQTGPATDVYGLGVILYEMLTGRVPLHGPTPLDTLELVRTASPVSPRRLQPGVPRDLDTICLKCLEKEPRKRYAAAEALADDLRRFLDGKPVLARPVGAAGRAAKWARRHPGRAAAVVAAAAVLVGVLVAWDAVRDQRAADRVDAERKRLTDLRDAEIAAEDQKRTAERVARADALMSAQTGEVPRVIGELAPVRGPARPKLRELAAAAITTRPGLHGRMALLADEPDRAAELADYLPQCRPDELLPVRELLRPHAAAVAPRLWAVLTGEGTEAGRRLRAACALAGLAADDPRWSAAVPVVVDQLLREDQRDVVVWEEALAPVRAVLLPELMRRYPASRDRLRSGKLGESELIAEAAVFDLTARLLARYTTDRPAELAELAATVDARHHRRFTPALSVNKPAVVPVLRAELAAVATPVWDDPPADPLLKPVGPATRKQIESADGVLAERFAFVQTLPLESFLPLALTLRESGYRPVRVRPHTTPHGLLAAAVWHRDGTDWRGVVGVTAVALRAADEQHRAAGFEPVDVAAWADLRDGPRPALPLAAALGGAAGWSAASPPLWYAAVWRGAPGGRPVTRLFAGVSGNPGERIPQDDRAKSFQAVQAVGVPGVGVLCSGVRGPVPEKNWIGLGIPEIVYRSRPENEPPVDVSLAVGRDGTPTFYAVWHRGLRVEAEQPLWLTPAEHVARGRELAAGGWRPVGLSLAYTAHEKAPPQARVAAVWHRPVPTEAARDALAARQANAAAALLLLDDPDPAWTVLRHADDPTARSYLIHRFAEVATDAAGQTKLAAALADRFRVETDVSARRALLLALGEFPPAALPPAHRDALEWELLRLYRDHPDPGLHSAADWLLRQKWGRAAEAAALDARLAADPPAGRRDWFVNSEGQTFAVVRGPVSFTLGSPPTEQNRAEGGEVAHPMRIDRTFAVATREVTVAEFLRFRPTHSWWKQYSPGLDTPAVSVTWYDAAAYCNWLSERDGIPPDQWCYEPNAAREYGPGMRAKPGHLRLTGYRLPSEAEWEFAARAGAATARHFGRPDRLLPFYAWGMTNAADRAWPVGRLKPNDLGLFDTLGNAIEWVGDRAAPYNVTTRADPDADPSPWVTEETYRVLRGGSFLNQPGILRTAIRQFHLPGTQVNNTPGFRPARTLPPGDDH